MIKKSRVTRLEICVYVAIANSEMKIVVCWAIDIGLECGYHTDRRYLSKWDRIEKESYPNRQWKKNFDVFTMKMCT